MIDSVGNHLGRFKHEKKYGEKGEKGVVVGRERKKKKRSSDVHYG